MTILRRSIRDGGIRTAVSWLLLLIFLFAQIGVAVQAPIVAIDKDPAEGRFPCEHRACGCRSADQCWRRCCCHSDSEKLRWAAKNGVRPPTFVIRRVAEALTADKAAKVNICCRTSSSSSTSGSNSAVSDRRDRSADVPGVCRARVNKTDPPSSEEVQNGEEAGSRFVLLWKAAECQGLQYLLSECSNLILTPAVSACHTADLPAVWVGLKNVTHTSPSHPPEPPVPRFLTASSEPVCTPEGFC